MKKTLLRTLSFTLAAVMCLGLFALFPALHTAAAESETRFIFTALSTKVGDYPANGTSISLPLDANPTFAAKNLSLVKNTGGTNAVFLSLVNTSPSTELTFSYEYVAYTPQKEIVTYAITPNSQDVQTLILNVPYIDSATAFSLSFGAETGTVELRSLFNISVHSPSFDEVVSVDVCRYNADTGTVEISGTIDWETTVLYSDATLALFAISPSEDVYLSNKVPVARTGISFTFSFSVPVRSVEDLYYRYIIAAITATGERVPLTTPYYPLVSDASQDSTEAFKGICTGNYESAIAGGAECATVEVCLDRVMGSQNGGILYAGDHSYYYFDADYVKTIDDAVRNLTGAGCRVFLRFLVSPDANNLSFVSYTEPGESLYGKGIYIRNEDALLTVYALTDFLTLRYSGDTAGRISGVILGQTVNRAALYNRTDAQTLAEDTEFLAAAFSVVSGVACRNIPGLSVMISLSDSSVGETLAASELTGEYPADLYLISFLETLNDYYLSPPVVHVLLESESTPSVFLSGSGNALNADHIDSVQALMNRLCTEYPNLVNRIGYSWFPDASLDAQTLQSTYAWLFLRLKLSGTVSSFYLNTSKLTEAEEKSVMNALSYLFSYIDTDRHSACFAPLLERLGVTSPEELFPSYSASLFTKRTVYRFSLSRDAYPNITPIGSYVLWTFATATNTLDWYAGKNCEDLSVLSANAGNLLTAHLSFENGFSGVARRFDYGKQLSFAPFLRFEMGVDGTSGTQYEVQVQLIGSASTVLASVILTSGESGVYCLDLSSCAANLADVTCIRLCARPLDGSSADANLYLRSVTLESTVYNDEELKAKISALGDAGETSDNGEERHDYTTPIIVTVVVILVSIAIAVILVIRYRNRKNSKDTDER